MKFISFPSCPVPQKTGDFKILHISDLHLDSEYVEGSEADCEFPLCCRDWKLAREAEGAVKNKTSVDVIAAKVIADADDPNMDSKV